MEVVCFFCGLKKLVVGLAAIIGGGHVGLNFTYILQGCGKERMIHRNNFRCNLGFVYYGVFGYVINQS